MAKYPLIDLKPDDMIAFSKMRAKFQEEQQQKRQQNNPSIRMANESHRGLPTDFCQYFAHVDEPLENNNDDDDHSSEGVDPSEWVCG